MPFDGMKTPEKLDILLDLMAKPDLGQQSYCSCLWHECVDHPRLIELGIRNISYDVISANTGKLAMRPPITKEAAAKFFFAGTPLSHVDYGAVGDYLFGGADKIVKCHYLKRLLELNHAL